MRIQNMRITIRFRKSPLVTSYIKQALHKLCSKYVKINSRKAVRNNENLVSI